MLPLHDVQEMLTSATDDRQAYVAYFLQAKLWWPAGYGAQPLYDVQVTFKPTAAAVRTTSRRIGFRQVANNSAAYSATLTVAAAALQRNMQV